MPGVMAAYVSPFANPPAVVHVRATGRRRMWRSAGGMGRRRVRQIGLVAALAAGIVVAAPQVQAQTTLRLGHNISATSPYQVGAEHFARLVAERTGNRYRVQIFPAGALGNEQNMLEGAQLGTIDMVVTSTAAIGPFVPQMQILDVPFLFRDAAHARAVVDGPVGEELIAAMTARNLVGLAFGEIGFRHVTANRAITTLDHMRGLKIRSQNNPVHLGAWRALGAQPSFIGFNELYAALQTGVVEANEQPLSIHAASRFFEVQRHLTLTSHLYGAAMFVISPSVFNRMTPADRDILRAAARESAPVMRRAVDEQDAAAMAVLRQGGMTIAESYDRDAFLRALEPFYAEMNARFGAANLQRIRDTRPGS
jgi:tripartite ATP-independent transporter DctP family solute receptor